MANTVMITPPMILTIILDILCFFAFNTHRYRMHPIKNAMTLSVTAAPIIYPKNPLPIPAAST